MRTSRSQNQNQSNFVATDDISAVGTCIQLVFLILMDPTTPSPRPAQIALKCGISGLCPRHYSVASVQLTGHFYEDAPVQRPVLPTRLLDKLMSTRDLFKVMGARCWSMATVQPQDNLRPPDQSRHGYTGSFGTFHSARATNCRSLLCVILSKSSNLAATHMQMHVSREAHCRARLYGDPDNPLGDKPSFVGIIACELFDGHATL